VIKVIIVVYELKNCCDCFQREGLTTWVALPMQTIVQFPGIAPVVLLATLLITSVLAFLADPELDHWLLPLSDLDACSATSILPPKEKLLVFTRVFYLANTLVSHLHASLTMFFTTSVSGAVAST
jgi:hypothetical protein